MYSGARALSAPQLHTRHDLKSLDFVHDKREYSGDCHVEVSPRTRISGSDSSSYDLRGNSLMNLSHIPAGPSPTHRAVMIAAAKEESFGDVLNRAAKRALGGGIAGAAPNPQAMNVRLHRFRIEPGQSFVI